MKQFIKYCSIFFKPFYIPFFLCLSFFIAYLVLLLSSNKEINLMVQSSFSEEGYFDFPLTFTLEQLKKGDYQHFRAYPKVKYVDYRYGSRGENKKFIANDPNFSLEEFQILKEYPEGIIVPKGYKAFLDSESMEVLGQELPVIAESKFDIYIPSDPDRSIFFHLSPEKFEELPFRDSSVSIYFDHIVNENFIEDMIQNLEEDGYELKNIRKPDFEKMLAENKLLLLIYQILIFSFLLFNLLFVFHYILETRKSTLSIFRILGLSKRKAATLISLELMLYSTVAFLVAFFLSWFILSQYSYYFQYTDVFLIFIISSFLVLVFSYILGHIVLSRIGLNQLKENIYD